MATITTSKKFSLHLSDWMKGLLMAVGTPVIAILIDSVNQGSLTFNWRVIISAALGGGLMYISKQFLASAKIVVTNASPEDVQAVKDGDAEIKLTPKP